MTLIQKELDVAFKGIKCYKINSRQRKTISKSGRKIRMHPSLFLAKAIGIYYVIVSIAFLLNKARLRALMIETMNNSAYLLLSGFIALIVGILLVVSHNLWVADWRVVIITIIGWLALLKGLTIIVFPNFLIKLSTRLMQNEVAYTITFLLVLLIGVILLYFGDTHR